MRKAFVQALADAAANDPRIVLLTGDLGYTVLEPFADRFPDRFVNAGVAEQNMMGMATGMAEAGLRPFVYSIAPFAILRPYEFFRNGAVLQKLPVTVVGVGGGVEYSHEGGTHFALEDLAVLRPLPTVRILAPSDPGDAIEATRMAVEGSAPTYLRLGKNEQWTLPEGTSPMAVEPRVVVSGTDVLILALGPVVREALGAAEKLAEGGISACVATANVLEGPSPALVELAEAFPVVATVEAHFVTGGLGSLLGESLAEVGSPTRLVRCGFRDLPYGESGSQDWWFGQAGLTSDGIARAVAELGGLA